MTDERVIAIQQGAELTLEEAKEILREAATCDPETILGDLWMIYPALRKVSE